MTVTQALEAARTHHLAGRLAEAEGLYRQILTQQPENPDALFLLGTLALEVGRFDIAVQLLTAANRLMPANAACYNNLGHALRSSGSLDNAIACFEQAVRLQNTSPQFHSNLGSALLEKGDLPRAVSVLRQAVALDANSSHCWFNLANALIKDGQIEPAISSYQRALEIDPQNVPALDNLGKILKNDNHLDEAISLFQRAIQIQPDYFYSHNNLGDAFRRQGDLPRAQASFQRAVELCPSFAVTHWNLGIVLLTRGQFREGWKEYAWRSRAKEFGFIRKEFSQPHWGGADLADKIILLHTEQGFGDSIQFIRYLPMLAARGARIVVGCEPELLPLLRPSFDVEQWVLPGGTLPAYDVHCPLMDFPKVFETTLETIPATVPYLSAGAAAVKRWKDRMAHIPGLKVGIAWSGRPTHFNDRNRSIPLEKLFPLANAADIAFVSLQKQGSAKSPTGPLRLIDWTDELTDFSETAALIENLDLVISVDTAVVHLAGALARPVWVLLPFAADWRWLENRSDSPWYPTMRLFRQPVPGDWSHPISEAAAALRTLAHPRESA